MLHMGFFLVVVSGGYAPVAVCGLLTAVASLVASTGSGTKCPDIPVSLKRNTEVFPHHFL